VHIVSPGDKKELELKIVFPEENLDPAEEDENDKKYSSDVVRYGQRYIELVKFIMERIKAGAGEKRTILVFTDSRRRAERISFFLNKTAEADPDFAGRPLSYCHHGSLSKEVRREVESALASGEIPCVVATGSLELGIDIGGVDEVILAGSPGAAAVALQRLGRSGHGVGMTSRGWLVPFHGADLLQAAAVAGAVEEKKLEETSSIENPLDLLAQIILALVTEKEWDEDEPFQTLRGFYVYRNLSKASFEGVVRMLAGAYEGSRLRELKRQVFRDDETGTLSPAPGTILQLYTSGGVITSRGYYSLRLAGNTEGAGTKIGELDEEFVFERRLGD
jgi:ATP-dependent Lhr-like helicase